MSILQNKATATKIVEEAYLEIEKEGLENDIPHMEQLVILSGSAKTENSEPSARREELDNRITGEISYLRENSAIRTYRPLVSNRRFLGPLLIFARRVMRRLLRFYIEPIVIDQSNYNAHLTCVLDLFQQAMSERDRQIRELKSALNKY